MCAPLIELLTGDGEPSSTRKDSAEIKALIAAIDLRLNPATARRLCGSGRAPIAEVETNARRHIHREHPIEAKSHPHRRATGEIVRVGDALPLMTRRSCAILRHLRVRFPADLDPVQCQTQRPPRLARTGAPMRTGSRIDGHNSPKNNDLRYLEKGCLG
jgi:hypothetical protein